MVKRYVGAAITSILLAGLASLTLSGVAYADDETVVGVDCAVTPPGEEGQELAVDGGLNVGGLELGLDADASELPVIGDSASGLLGNETPAVVGVAEVADEGCGLVKDTAKAAIRVGVTALEVLPGELRPESPAVPLPEPPVDEPVEDPVPGDDGDAGQPDDGVDAVEGESLPVEAPVYEAVAYMQPATGPLPAFTLPVPPLATQGPDLNGDKDDFAIADKNSGRAHALPAETAAESPKLPLMLAVALLAAVAAVLVRRLITRSVA